MPLDDPGAVVGRLEPLQCQAELLDRLEAPQPQQVLLERTDEPLGAAVALGLADEGGRALHAEEADLGLEVVADVLATVVVAEPQTGGDVPAEGTVAPPDGLPDRLERLEAVRVAGSVDAQALGRAVVDGDEHRGLALAGHHRGHVGAPHGVDPLGRDRAPSWAFGPCGLPARWWAGRPCSRVSRRTRRRLVRMPAKRSR